MNPFLTISRTWALLLLAGAYALAAEPSPTKPTPAMPDAPQLEKATFGAGCFWGVEYQYAKIPGVKAAVCGYAGGKVVNPTYEDVCSHTSGHAEVIEVTFDPKKVSYRTLVEYFFKMHDPTQVDRQGPDVGDQYRSVIFTHSPEQQKVAEEVKAALTKAKVFNAPIATQVAPAPVFWRAEEYHQRHYQLRGTRPYCHLVPFAEENK
ncbi:peptide methionine sulfoxide reductase MsrA [Verrucomicrobiota bacterium]|nr:peptide methionine sulfoxide reductase MsrA [Verrucomicrobiota bacterium]